MQSEKNTPKQSSLEEFVADFSASADKARERLSEMLALLADGRVPQRDTVADLDVTMEVLRAKYDAVYSLTKSMVPKKALPKAGCSVNECVEAVRISELEHIRAQLSQAEVILQRFTTVRSLVDRYAKALAPYQEKALELLKQLEAVSENINAAPSQDTEEKEAESEDLSINTEDISGKIIEESANHELFLKALDMEDLNEDEELLNKLDSIYSARIQLGLTTKKYFIPGEARSDSAPEEEPASMPEMLAAHSEVRDLPARPKVFENDLKESVRRGYNEVFTILPLFTHFGVMTGEQIYSFGMELGYFDPDEITNEKLSRILDWLIEKNCLVTYEVEAPKYLGGPDNPDSEETAETEETGETKEALKASEVSGTSPELTDAYCLTYYCYVCMNKDSIAPTERSTKHWRIPYGHRRVYGKSTIEKAVVLSILDDNALLLYYLRGIKLKFRLEEFMHELKPKTLLDDYKKTARSIVWKREHYFVSVPWTDKNYLCQVVHSFDEARSSSAENFLIISTDSEPDNEHFFKDFDEEFCRSHPVFVFRNNLLSRAGGEDNDSEIVAKPARLRQGQGVPVDEDTDEEAPEIDDAIGDTTLDEAERKKLEKIDRLLKKLSKVEESRTSEGKAKEKKTADTGRAKPKREKKEKKDKGAETEEKKEKKERAKEREEKEERAELEPLLLPLDDTDGTEGAPVEPEEDSITTALPDSPKEDGTFLQKVGKRLSRIFTPVNAKDINDNGIVDAGDDAAPEVSEAPEAPEAIDETEDADRAMAPDIVSMDNDGPEDDRTPEEVLENINDALVSHSDAAQASRLILKAGIVPDDALMKEIILALVRSTEYEAGDGTEDERKETDILYRSLVRAAVLAAAALPEENYPGCRRLRDQLLLATALPLSDGNVMEYTGTNLLEAFAEDEERPASLMLAAYFYALMSPQHDHDYFTLQPQCARMLAGFDSMFPSFPALKPLFSELCEVCRIVPEGFSNAVLSSLGSEAENAEAMDSLRSSAAFLLTGRVSSLPIIEGLPDLLNACFGRGSDIYGCMEIISQDRRDELELVSDVLSEYYDGEEDFSLRVLKPVLEEKIDRVWTQVKQTRNTVKLPDVKYRGREKIISEIFKRLSVMKDWLDLLAKKHNYDIEAIRDIRARLLEKIDEQLSGFYTNVKTEEPGFNGSVGGEACVVYRMLGIMRRRLTGGENPEGKFPFADLLTTGIIPLDERGIPVLDESLCDVKYYEPWRNVLRHIAAPVRTLDEAEREIFKRGSPMFDNLRQLEMIEKIKEAAGERDTEQDGPEDGSSYGSSIISQDILQDALRAAENATEDFKRRLGWDYTLKRISEDEKEILSEILEDRRADFFGTNRAAQQDGTGGAVPEEEAGERDGLPVSRDFGCWRQFLHALELQIEEITALRQKALQQDLERCRASLPAGQHSTRLDEAERLLNVEKNFIVTEDHISRLSNKEFQLTEDELAAAQENEHDEFSAFFSDEVFEPFYEECRRNDGHTLKSFGMKYLISKKDLIPNWTSRHREDSRDLLENWPARKRSNTPEQIRTLFSSLGFTVEQVRRVEESREEQYDLFVTPTPSNRTDYRHPISAFGTRMMSPLSVVVLYGNHPAREIVDTLVSMDLNGTTVVLMDYYLSRATYRQVAEIFHTQTSGQKPFLLIDQVMALYLATRQSTERLPVMLRCTLPCTMYQPFLRDGGAVADEMFYGRRAELTSIIEPNGACIVYGGRQLGKTALLQRAESRFHAPQNNAYSVYVDIKDYREVGPVVDKIVDKITKKTDLPLRPCASLKALCDQLDSMFRSDRDPKISSMLLLIDEADNFLEAISTLNYTPLQPLIELKRETKNNFKFVLAGLHNVRRAKHATALNGVFGQLGSALCIKPLSPSDAIQLLSRPLRYLGFQIPVLHLATILANTNYYPGILQFFGYTLVQTLKGNYSKYYHANTNNPPYPLQDDQLGSVMSDADLNRSIRDKFRYSLELDPRYFMLARCVALLYHYYKGEGRVGFSVQDIGQVVDSYDIHCLENESPSNLEILLDEMVDMGILSCLRQEARPGLYRLRLRAFADYIGSGMEELEADIRRENGDGTDTEEAE